MTEYINTDLHTISEYSNIRKISFIFEWEGAYSFHKALFNTFYTCRYTERSFVGVYFMLYCHRGLGMSLHTFHSQVLRNFAKKVRVQLYGVFSPECRKRTLCLTVATNNLASYCVPPLQFP